MTSQSILANIYQQTARERIQIFTQNLENELINVSDDILKDINVSLKQEAFTYHDDKTLQLYV